MILGFDFEECFMEKQDWIELKIYSYFEKGCRKKCARDNPER